MQQGEKELISRLLQSGRMNRVVAAGITPEVFHSYRPEYEYILDQWQRHSEVPSVKLFREKFPDFPYRKVVGGDPSVAPAIEAVLENHLELSLAQVAEQFVNQLGEQKPAELLAQVQTRLQQLTAVDAGEEQIDIVSDIMTDVAQFERLQNAEAQGESAYVPAPWQPLNDYWGGLRGGELVGIIARANNGKALESTEPVLTPLGWVPIGELEVGDEVCAVDGTATAVTGVHPQGLRDAYRVEMTDGTSVVADGDHLWSVASDRKPDVFVTMTTTELLASGLTRAGQKTAWWRLPIANPVPLRSPKRITVDPYTLGVLLGDGCLHDGLWFTNSDEDLIQRVRDALPDGYQLNENSEHRTYRICRERRGDTNEILQCVRSMGLDTETRSDNKFIPQHYLWSSLENRIALLQGLLDTDGHVEGIGSIHYTTVSVQLAEDVKFLVRSLGGVVRHRMKSSPVYTTSDGTRKSGKSAHCLVIWLPDEIEPFSIARKAQRRGKRKKGQTVKIKSITPVGERDCTCITVDHPSHLFITRDFIVTHNSWLGIQIAAHAALYAQSRPFIAPLEMSRYDVACRLHSIWSYYMARDKSPKHMTLPAITNRARIAEMMTGRSVWQNTHLAIGSNKIDIAEYKDWAEMVKTAMPRGFIMPNMTAQTTSFTIDTFIRHIERSECDIAVLDYLSLLDIQKRKGESQWEIWQEVTRRLKREAMRLNIPIVVMGQANRNGATQRTPELEDIAFSDAFGQNADRVLSLRQTGERMAVTCIKNRIGQKQFRFWLNFMPDFGILEYDKHAGVEENLDA